MNRRRRPFGRLWIVLGVLLILGAASIVYLRSGAFLAHVRPFVERAASKWIGRPTHIAAIERPGAGILLLRDLSILEPDGKSPILSIQTVTIRYDRLPLLRGEAILDDVVLRGVAISIREVPESGLNIDPLLSVLTGSGASQGPPLPLRIRLKDLHVEDGALTFEDRAGRNVRVQRLRARSQPGKALPLGDPRPLQIQTGKWDFRQSGHLLSADSLVVESVLAGDRLIVDNARLKRGNTSLVARGKITFVPVLDLTIDGDVRIQDVRSWQPGALAEVHGRITFQGLRVVGPPDRLRARGDLRFVDLATAQLGLAAMEGRLETDFAAFSLKNVHTSWLGGRIEGEIQADGETITLEARAEGLEIAKVRRAFLSETASLNPLTGHVDGTFVASVGPDGFGSKGKWTLTDAAWNGRTIAGTPTIQHRIDASGLSVEADIAGAHIAARGALPGERLNLNVRVTTDDVAGLAGLADVPSSGPITFTADVSGSVRQPAIAFALDWQGGLLRGLPIQSLTARGRWARSTLRFDAFELASGDGVAALAGSITLGADVPRVDLRMDAERFDLEPLAWALRPDVAIRGQLDGEIELKGPLRHLTGRGVIRLVGLSIQGVPFAVDPIDVVAEDGTFAAPSIAVRLGPAVLAGEAIFSARRYRVDLALSEPVRVAELAEALPDGAAQPIGELRGLLDLSLKGEADYSSPILTATIRLDDARFRSASLGENTLELRYENGQVRGDGRLSDGAYTLDATARVNQPGMPFEATLSFDNTDVLPLVKLIGTSAGPGLRRTELDGALVLRGELARWREAVASIRLDSMRLSTDQFQLASTRTIHGTVSSSSVELKDVSLKSPDSAHPFEVSASGLLDLNRPIGFSVSARQFDLEMVSDYLGLPGFARGVGTYRLRMWGTALQPKIEMTWDVPRAEVRIREGVPPLTLTAIEGNATYADRRLTLDRLEFRAGGSPFEVSGTVPMSLSFVLVPLVKQLVDAPLHLVVKSESKDLSWLASFDPNLRSLTGTGTLNLIVEGSLSAPRLSGSVNVTASNIEAGLLRRPIDRIALQGRFVTETPPGGDRLMRADIVAEARVGKSVVRTTGAVSYPLSITRILRAFEPAALKGAFDLELVNVTLSSVADLVGVGPLPIAGDVSGSGHIDVVGVDPLRWTGRATLDRVRLEGNGRVLQSDGDASIRYRDGSVRLERLVLASSGQKLSVSGTFTSDGGIDARVDAREVALALFGGFVRASVLQGRATAQAVLTGTLDAPRFKGTWALADVRYDRLTLNRFEGGVSYDGDTLHLSGWEFASYGNRLSLTGDVPVSIRLSPSGEMIRAREEPLSIALRTTAFDIGFAPFVLPALREASGIAEIDLEVTGPATRPYLRGSITVPDGAFVLAHNGLRVEDATFSLDADRGRINLTELAFRVGDASYKMASTRLDMDGLRPMRLETAVEFRNASIETWLADRRPSVTTHLTGKISASVAIDRLRRDGRAGASWTAGPTKQTVLAALARVIPYIEGRVELSDVAIGAVGYQMRNEQPLAASFRQGRLVLPKFHLHQERRTNSTHRFSAEIAGTWDVGNALNITIAGEIGPSLLNEWVQAQFAESGAKAQESGAREWLRTYLFRGEAPPLATGLFQYELSLSGTGADPQIGLSLRADSLAIGQVAIEDVRLDLSYVDDRARLIDGEFIASGTVARVRGYVPFRVSLLDGTARRRDGDFQIQLDSELANLDLVPLVFPQVERPAGRGVLHLTLGGEFADPDYQGALELTDVRFDLPDNRIAIRNASVGLTFSGDVVRVSRLEGIVNGGRFRVSTGTVTLTDGVPSSVDIQGSVRGSTFDEPGLYRVTCDANLRFSGPIDNVLVEGDVLPTEVLYERDWRELVRENFRSRSQAAMREKARFNYPVLRGMELDVRVQAARNVVLDVGNARVESRLEGRIVGPLAELVFVGEVTTIEGQFTYRGRVFDITSGRIWNTNPSRFNPSYEIHATSHRPLQNVVVLDSQDRRNIRNVLVRVTLTGTLEQALPPDFEAIVQNPEPGEDYAMTREQVVALLTFGDASVAVDISEEGLQAAGSLLRDSVTSLVGGRLATALGLQTFRVDLAAQDIEDTRFQFTKELSSGWAVTYSSTLILGQEQRIEVDYRMNRHLAITGERNEEGRYGLDLKLEYEFR